jgi:hypothetical protein
MIMATMLRVDCGIRVPTVCEAKLNLRQQLLSSLDTVRWGSFLRPVVGWSYRRNTFSC